MYRTESLSFTNVITSNINKYYPLKGDALQSYKRFMDENFTFIREGKEFRKRQPAKMQSVNIELTLEINCCYKSRSIFYQAYILQRVGYADKKIVSGVGLPRVELQ